MKKLLLIIGLALSGPAFAQTCSFTSNTSDCAITLPNGEGWFNCSGDWGTPAGTVALQQFANGSYANSSATTWTDTSDGYTINIEIKGAATVRLNLSGATSPTLNCEIEKDL